MNTLHYDFPLFRPPSEAESLIFQITLGCSWNKCIFCEMYKTKSFSVKKAESVFEEIRLASSSLPDTRRVFLGDGDAMVLKSDHLLKIVKNLKVSFPLLRRISCYASPGNLVRKSHQELKELKEAGLKIIYCGIESGDEEVLRLVNKGESYRTIVDGLSKARDAGIKTSVMILNGLGGKRHSLSHAQASASVVNEVRPDYLSTLVLMHTIGEKVYRRKFGKSYEPMTPDDILLELRTFIDNIHLERCVFRSDHASNYLFLKGVLSRDKNRLLDRIDHALNPVNEKIIREEWLRSL